MAPRDDAYIEEAFRRGEEKKTHVSFPQLKYPSLRDEGLRDSQQWLTGKALDDGAEGLWRVHDKLYDLNEFMDRHPGGRDWLHVTKGTDITEAFESHHIKSYVKGVLEKYYIRDAKTPRNSPFTFKEDGFYMSFKAAVEKEIRNIPKDLPTYTTFYWSCFLASLFLASIYSCYLRTGWGSLFAQIIASLALTWLTICTHNYVHMKDNWKMYFFGMSLNSLREWRISHCLSHHLYPNTLLDMEITMTESLLPYMPRKKTFYCKLAFLVELILFPFFFHSSFLKRVMLIFMRENYLKDMWSWKDLFGFTLPAAMWLFSGADLWFVMVKWTQIVLLGSFIFCMIGFNAAHHHPDIFHDGDQVESNNIDWGVHELAAVMDRPEITGKLFRVLTFFGDHALHHLFPTLDHAMLPYLYPLFFEYCKKHNTEFRQKSQLELFLGQIKQLSKQEPKLLNKTT